jgi:hypothetical protein
MGHAASYRPGAGGLLLQPPRVCVLSCCAPPHLQIPAAAGHDGGPATSGGAHLPDLGHGICKDRHRGYGQLSIEPSSFPKTLAPESLASGLFAFTQQDSLLVYGVDLPLSRLNSVGSAVQVARQLQHACGIMKTSATSSRCHLRPALFQCPLLMQLPLAQYPLQLPALIGMLPGTVSCSTHLCGMNHTTLWCHGQAASR